MTHSIVAWPWALLTACLFVSAGHFETVHAQDLLISEFMAAGGSELEDEDGDTPDWIEILSLGASAVNLDGWYLTDDALDPFKWRFPNRMLAPGDTIVVFASGKQRIEGEELHSNFRLSSEPGYLALIAPDGTIVHEYDTYPRQLSGKSYGLTQAVEESIWIADGADLSYKVPADGSDALEWIDPDFADGSWSSGPGPFGFDTDDSPDLPPDQQTNLALGGTARQSSTAFGGSASRAIDGNNSGSYGSNSITHTGNEVNTWWEVDLGDTFALSRFVLWNRQDCCSERLSNFEISVLDDARQVVTSSEHFTDQGVPATSNYTIDLAGGTRGRFVRLSKLGPDRNGDYYISLSEVEVFGGEAGYGPIIGTDVESSLESINSSIYLRAPFHLNADDISAASFLSLNVMYDDGFSTYLNGELVASRNAPGALSWSSSASKEHPDDQAVVPEDINLSNFVDMLRIGQNVIAVHALNLASDDDDFLFGMEFKAKTIALDALRYFSEPTPGAANPEGGDIGFVEDTRFSVDRGFYDAPFDVTILSATAGATIRYTTDGSVPTATRGSVYSGPVRIAATTVLRAAAFKTGLGPTNIDTHTYIFLRDVIDSSVMDTAITRNPTFAPQMRGALTDLPSISLVTASAVRGESEVPGSIEWIPGDGSAGFQEETGVRYFGGAFTNFDKKNFRLYFRKIYGAGKLKFPLFKGHDRGIPAVEEFDQLELRGGSHDMNRRGFYMSNRFTDDTMLDMGNLNPHGQFVHLYRNGTYWGQYHLRERWNADMQAQYLGGVNGQSGEKEDYEAINGNWNVGGWPDPGVPYDGNGSAWTRIKSLRDDFEAVSPYLDVAHYVDFMLMFMYGNSEDEYRCVGPTAPGSGFKFFLNDADGFTRSAGNRTNMGQPGRANGDGPGSIFSMLLAEGDPDYKTLLGDRIHKHYFDGGAMTPAKMTARLLERCDEVERAFIAESARWGYRSPASWASAKNSYISGVLPSRTGTVIGYFRAAGFYPRTVAPQFNRNGGPVPSGFGVSLTAPAGKIYATIDGTDPRLPGGAISPDAILIGDIQGTTVLAAGAAVQVHVPQDDSLGLDWTERDFDDAGWRAGTTGVGFETGSGYEDLIETDIEDLMHGQNSSAYIRVPFDIEDPAAVTFLVLRMKYDDGYIAYVNGVEVASRNAPADATWNSRSDGSHSDSLAVVFESVDIGIGLGALRPGRNVLAIHGFNTTASGGDFLMLPEIEAAEASGGLIVEESSVVKARVRVGASWSALSEATFVVDLSLRVTELMYHPPAPLVAGPFSTEDFEYIELKNIGVDAIDLIGLRLAGGISFDFATGTVDQLPPGELILVVRNLAAFESRYGDAGFLIAGEYQRHLANAGDRVEIRGRVDEEILGFDYADSWHPTTDGGGFSLVHIDPASDLDTWNDPASWRPSDSILGTPGIDDSGDPGAGGWQLIGDANQDAAIDLSDGISILRHLFLGDPIEPPCKGDSLEEAGNRILLDPNGDTRIDLSDAIYLLEFLFLGGSPPTLGAGCVRIAGCPSICVF